MVKKRKQLPAKLQPVTREMLSRLRDEIEDVLQQSRKDNDASEYSRNCMMKALKENAEIIESMKKDVLTMQRVLGLDRTCPPYAAALGEHITASYFHSWIARINERLEKLEKS